jgi:mannose-1-phosphate guanylyltransferase
MHIVIMAGGSGTRFWPVSRAARPKQLLNIIGDQPMVRATYERVKKLVSDSQVLVVVGDDHLAETRELFADTAVRILAEPVGRNTAPCIGLTASFVGRTDASDPMVVLPADHYIAKPAVFCAALREAAAQAQAGGIVTLGIVPTRPETGYGYIELDSDETINGEARIYHVRKFVEKPTLETAKHYLVSGNYYWNAGIFVATPRTLLGEFARFMPEFHRGLEQLAGSFHTAGFDRVLAELYQRTESISFDYAIMEKTAQPVWMIPCDCGWSDVGSWNSLYEVRQAEQDEQGNLLDGKGLLLDSRDCFVMARGGRLVAALGLRNVLVVDTEDSLLVADLERSQDIKQIIRHLRQQGRKELL